MYNKQSYNKFKDIKRRINEICDTYRLCLTKFNNRNNELLNPDSSNLTMNRHRNYVRTVNLVLKCLEDEDARLIKKFGIERAPIVDIGYSLSTFYSRYKKAAVNFLKYFS